MEGSVLMVYVPDMLPIVLNELGKAHFKATMSWAAAVEGGVSVNLGFRGLRPDLGFVAGGLDLLALRAGRGSLVLDREGLLSIVLLMMMPIWGPCMGLSLQSSMDCYGNCHREGKCILEGILGVLEGCTFGGFLKLPLGELRMVMATMYVAARLGTLNSRIPKCSDVAYKSRIMGLLDVQTHRIVWGMT